MDTETIREIIERNDGTHDGLIATLSEIQNKFDYLSEEALETVAEITNRSLIDLYSIASFYKAFSLTPRGKHLCNVCVGTACHVRGAVPILEEMERKLGIHAGETTKDMMFTLKTVNCLGACALGPIVTIDEDYHGNTTIQKVEEILSRYGHISEEQK